MNGNVPEYIELTKIYIDQFSKRTIGRNLEPGLTVSRIFNKSYVVGGIFGINRALMDAASLATQSLSGQPTNVELYLFENPNTFMQLGFSDSLKEGKLTVFPTNEGYEAFKSLLKGLGGEVLSTDPKYASKLYELLSNPHFS